MAYYDKDELKESLTIEQVFQLMETLNADPIMTGFGLMCRTICHNGRGSGSNKLYYYTNTQLFNCYTGCGYMDIFELIMRVEDTMSFYSAMDYVARTFGLEGVDTDLLNSNQESQEDLEILERYKRLARKNESIEVEYDIYNDSLIQNLSLVPPAGWLKEGITIDAMERYNIRYYGTEHKIVIPHYNIDNQLIGIRGRTMLEDDEVAFGKYMPLQVGGKMFNHPLSQNLYGLEHNLENIQAMKQIVIYEGEKSVLLHDSLFGAENNISVATCGNSLSLIQQEIIEKFCEVDEVIIAYDKDFEELGDDNFNDSVARLKRIAKRMNNLVRVSILFDKEGLLNYKDAPIDQGREVFEQLYNNRIFL